MSGTRTRITEPTHTDRAASTVVSYILTLGITAILVTGLLTAGGSFVDDQRQGTIRDELRVLGQQLASDLSAADRLARSGGTEVSVTRGLPDEVTGVGYHVTVEDSTAGPNVVDITLRTENPDVSVTLGVHVGTDVGASGGGTVTHNGGDLVIELDGDHLEVNRV